MTDDENDVPKNVVETWLASDRNVSQKRNSKPAWTPIWIVK
jgi:hypothetical protein